MKKSRFREGTPYTRRQFLRMSGGCAAMSQLPLLSTLVTLGGTRAAMAAAPGEGYKALVCLFLHGGNDSYNMLIPTDAGPYADYSAARSNLAHPLDDPAMPLHRITDAETGREYGVHSSMPDIASLYGQGQLSFVNNVGTLIEPIDQSNYDNGGTLPLGLYSHSDQQRHWQTSVPQSRTQLTGWAGRMADLLNDSVNSNTAIPMNIAIDHLNILQTGDGIVPYIIDDKDGAELLKGYLGTGAQDRIVTRATDYLLDNLYSDLLKSTHANYRRRAIDAAISYSEAAAEITFTTVFPDTKLGRSLHQIAKSIGASNTLGQSQQMFLAEMGGFDNHDGLLTQHPELLAEINDALKAFNDALTELQCQNDVLTFTISDFARTLNSNGNGSDHAWGGNQIVMGGGLQGGRMYGHYPDSLAPDNPLDVGRGRLIPTTSVDEFNAELAMWFGIANDNTLVDILPNIRNFLPAGSPSPLGMFA